MLIVTREITTIRINTGYRRPVVASFARWWCFSMHHMSFLHYSTRAYICRRGTNTGTRDAATASKISCLALPLKTCRWERAR